MLGIGCRKLAVCCVKHPWPVIILYRSIVMNLKVLICIHMCLHSAHTKDIVGIQWEVFNVKLSSQCPFLILHQKCCISHQVHDIVRF